MSSFVKRNHHLISFQLKYTLCSLQWLDFFYQTYLTKNFTARTNLTKQENLKFPDLKYSQNTRMYHI